MTLIVLFLLAAAGAGGYAYWRYRTEQYMPPDPAIKRGDLLYGYYGRDDAQCAETAGAVNLAFEMRWDALDAAIARMRLQPVKTILGVNRECWVNDKTPRPAQETQAMLHQTFDALRAAGVLGQVAGFYVLDEPDLWGISDADMTAACASVRHVAAEYPELDRAVLVCCYSNSGRFPGLASFDWVGLDDYPQGSNMLIGAPMRALRAAMGTGQRLMLVPGGCDPFKGNPEAFRRVAQADPRVVAIVPFLWRDYNDPSGKPQAGIRSNGMDSAYAVLGAELVNNRPNP